MDAATCALFAVVAIVLAIGIWGWLVLRDDR